MSIEDNKALVTKFWQGPKQAAAFNRRAARNRA